MASSTGNGGPDKGSAGIYTYYQRDGKTIMRVKHNKKSHRPPTMARAGQMSKFPNLIQAWRSLNGGLRGCFPQKKAGATDYSAFMSANLLRARVHLSKEVTHMDVCLVDNFVLSLGGLPNSIQVCQTDEWMLSDIMFGTEPRSPRESLMDFFDRLKGHNPGRFHAGDELLFVRMTQKINTNFHTPMVETTVNRIPLEADPRTSVDGYFFNRGTRDGFEVVDGRLAARREKDSLVAWIHKHPKRRGRWDVTSQTLVGENTMLAQYTDAESITVALDSYRPAPVPYLASMAEPTEEAVPAPTAQADLAEALALVEKIKQNPQALALLKELLKD